MISRYRYSAFGPPVRVSHETLLVSVRFTKATSRRTQDWKSFVPVPQVKIRAVIVDGQEVGHWCPQDWPSEAALTSYCQVPKGVTIVRAQVGSIQEQMRTKVPTPG